MTEKTTELLSLDEVKALFEGVGAPADKLDEFVEVFNAAVTAQSNARVETLVAEKVAELEAAQEAHIKHLDEAAEQFKALTVSEMDAKLQSYMTHFAEEFVAENKPVLTSNVKADLFESLMTQLKGVFEAHNIVLSDEGKDVLAANEAKLAETEATLKESQAAVIELTRQINEGKKADILSAAVADLTESQAEKVRELSADIVFGDTYAEKVQRIVEAIASKQAPSTPATTEVVTEGTNVPAVTPVVDARMAAYLAAAKGGKPSIPQLG